jgi:hypothetical protein
VLVRKNYVKEGNNILPISKYNPLGKRDPGRPEKR